LPPIRARREDFDNKPWLFNTKNGTINLKTGVLQQPSPEDMLTKQAPVVYDPEAEAPVWEVFLRQVFAGETEEETEETIAAVQRLFGYTMSGSAGEEVFIICHGPQGNNGKSTMMNAIVRVLGENAYAATMQPSALVQRENEPSHQTELASLKGARFVRSAEPPPKKEGEELVLNMTKIKAMTGNEPLSVRHAHGRPFTYQPEFTLWLSTNPKPVIKEKSKAAARRVILVGR
jgi:putative DNA primase/helicase